uniref:Putative licpodalin-4 1 n=1 Tax=Ixodes ricinus TaxID=34613 RepID=V5GLS0_IXORI
MKLVLSLAIFACGSLVGTSGVNPPIMKIRNATGVVEMNATQWVKWRTYNLTDPSRGNPLQCENFKVVEKRTPTNYSLQYTYRSGNRWEARNETLMLYDHDKRGFPYIMYFARKPDDLYATYNLLLYSNYVNCTILRIPFRSQGKRHCDLWMANTTASQEPPELCKQRIY